jgi:hypothetical protein
VSEGSGAPKRNLYHVVEDGIRDFLERHWVFRSLALTVGWGLLFGLWVIVLAIVFENCTSECGPGGCGVG